jgi:aromatic ring-cleaving dioxygenase
VFGDIASFTMRKFVGEIHGQLIEWFRGSNARGLILIDHHVRQHPADDWVLDTVTFGVDLAPDHPKYFTMFNDQYRTGLPTAPI